MVKFVVLYVQTPPKPVDTPASAEVPNTLLTSSFVSKVQASALPEDGIAAVGTGVEAAAESKVGAPFCESATGFPDGAADFPHAVTSITITAIVITDQNLAGGVSVIFLLLDILNSF
jgi:hypothetical protein